MATGGPSNQNPDVGGERHTNQGAPISSGVAEIKTFSIPGGSLILNVAEALHRGGVAKQTYFSSFVDDVRYY